MKKISNKIGLAALAGTMAVNVACSDFLNTSPVDQLSPATTWKTEADARAFMIGVYNGWTGDDILYMDCNSDIAYNFHVHEGFKNWANGKMTPSYSNLVNYYGFSTIQRANIFMANIDNVTFGDEAAKKEMIAQVRALRAYKYFELNWIFGGVPIVDYYATAEDAKVPRNTEAEVTQYIFDELDAAIPDLSESPAGGYWSKGAALALKMRTALFYGEWQKAADAAAAIMAMKKYSLEPSFATLFSLAGQGSPEIILAQQSIPNTAGMWLGFMYNNSPESGAGWSSIVPTQNLVDMYEMANGLTKEEAGSGYDETHPFAGRDPRMAASIIFPGMDFNGHIVNTLDQQLPPGADGKPIANPDHPTAANNASKTALTWGKYLLPMSQYPDTWSTGACLIIFRYAEVLLSFAEAKNEVSGPAADVYDAIDLVRERAGMPKVDRTKYATRETLRELIRRERTIELAGEGLRRQDILRWKDASGKLVAETVLNKDLYRITGTVNYDEPDPFKRATVTGTTLEEGGRSFSVVPNRYMPIPQSSIDRNPKLKQNDGY